MNKRQDIIRLICDLDCDTKIINRVETIIEEYINEIEGEVNEALHELENINSVENLDNVASARDMLKNLSRDLY